MPDIKTIQPFSAQYAGDSSPGPGGRHLIAARNGWSRVALSFQDLVADAWHELSFHLASHPDESAGEAADMAVVGVTFLAEDGSTIDFADVPGLTRDAIDPYCAPVAGSAYRERSADDGTEHPVRIAFFVPSPACQLTVTIRSRRNEQPFEVVNPLLRLLHEPDAGGSDTAPLSSALPLPSLPLPLRAQLGHRLLSADPHWVRYALVPGGSLVVRGQVTSEEPLNRQALVRVIYRDGAGEPLAPPYAGTLESPMVGTFLHLPTDKKARRFTLELDPPAGAAVVELGFQAWSNTGAVGLMGPLELSLEGPLTLEALGPAATGEAGAFLARFAEQAAARRAGGAAACVAEMLGGLADPAALARLIVIQKQLGACQLGGEVSIVAGRLCCADQADWRLPAEPTWSEDPYQSLTWRLRYRSLSWLADLATTRGRDELRRAVALALSWTRAEGGKAAAGVIEGQRIDLRLVAVQAEALLQVAVRAARASGGVDRTDLVPLLGQVVRQAMVLAEALAGNAYADHGERVHAAAALLAVARALPALPLAAYWGSLALQQLRDGFDVLLAGDGLAVGQSAHHHLETLALALVLYDVLGPLPDAASLRERLAAGLVDALVAAIALTDAGGMLAPLGDTLLANEHAALIKDIVTRHGRGLLAAEGIAGELAHRSGAAAFLMPHSGLAVMRHRSGDDQWGYFCAQFAGQPQARGHYDCGSFVFAARGHRWITDPGGFARDADGPARQYLVSSRAHNVAVPDGREQTAGSAALLTQAIIHGAAVLQIGTNVYGADYLHRRVFIIAADLSAMAVFDRFATAGRPVSVQGFLHLEPEATMAIANPRLVVAFRDGERLRIRPHMLAGKLGGLEVLYGLDDRPSNAQGLVSRRPGAIEPASVLRYRFSGVGSVCGGVVLALGDEEADSLARLLETPELAALLGAPLAF